MEAAVGTSNQTRPRDGHVDDLNLSPDEEYGYRQMFNQCTGGATGKIPKAAMISLLKQSRLPPATLNQVCSFNLFALKMTQLWQVGGVQSDVSDVQWPQFVKLLRLVAMAQFQQTMDIAAAGTRQPRVAALYPDTQSGQVDWSIAPEDAMMYQQFYRQRLQWSSALQDRLPVDACTTFLMQSQLSKEVLAQVWELGKAVDQLATISLHRFSVMMHLIKRYKNGVKLPAQLPPALLFYQTPSMTGASAMSGATLTSNNLANMSQQFIMQPSMTGGSVFSQSQPQMPFVIQTGVGSGAADAKYIADGTRELTSKQDQINGLTSNLSTLTQDVSELSAKKAKLTQELADVDAKKSELTAKVSAVRAERDREVNQVREMQSAYLTGQQQLDDLAKRVQQESAETDQIKQRRVDGAKYIEQLHVQVAQLNDQLVTLSRQKLEAAAAFNADKDLFTALANQQSQLSAQVQQLDVELDQLVQLRQQQSQQNSQMLKDNELKQQEVARLQKSVDDAKMSATPSVVASLPVTTAKDLFNWDAKSFTSTKSEPVAVSVQQTVARKNSIKSLNAMDVTKAQADPFAAFRMESIVSQEDMFSKPASIKVADDIFGSSAAVTSAPIQQDPFTDVISPEVKAVINLPTTAVPKVENSSTAAFDAKFPALDDFEMQFQAAAQSTAAATTVQGATLEMKLNPFDEFDADFASLTPAAPVALTNDAIGSFGAADFFGGALSTTAAANPFAGVNSTQPDANPFGSIATQQPLNGQASVASFQDAFSVPAAKSAAVSALKAPAEEDIDSIFGGSSVSNAPAATVIKTDDIFGAVTTLEPPAYSHAPVTADMSFFDSIATAPSLPAAPKTLPQEIKDVVAMGFSEEQARNALIASGNDVQQAIHILLDQSGTGEGAAKPSHEREGSSESAKGSVHSRGKKSSVAPSDVVDEKKSKRASRWFGVGSKK